ncbi:hypothetical protein [Pseudooctadecabacter jejudonensis]|uniref:Uncharacterized protein n=1 Tax=Pseudooctadecabacter jejudonensis TaxID=1391910 RepID=A0A1Y5S0V3_9RHOB|nr:hypothetical protein [Pseudooctadecabacter jejudonensis]SLN30099.1 hypothetical protein PSJ8397_01362 [Pseudooctadecabacter jejudonensis]
MIPLQGGTAAGAAIVASLYWIGALKERSGLAVLVAAVAFFWPVFAFQAGAGNATIALHSLIFIAFAALAAFGFRTSARFLAGLLIAHGALDGVLFFTGHPGPHWWPAFCASLDITAGLALLVLIHKNKVAA